MSNMMKLRVTASVEMLGMKWGSVRPAFTNWFDSVKKKGGHLVVVFLTTDNRPRYHYI